MTIKQKDLKMHYRQNYKDLMDSLQSVLRRVDTVKTQKVQLPNEHNNIISNIDLIQAHKSRNQLI